MDGYGTRSITVQLLLKPLLQGLREREGDLVQGRREGDPVSDVYSADVKKRRSSSSRRFWRV